MSEPVLEYIGELRAQLDMPQQVGAGPHGIRVIYPAVSGSFVGPNIKAEIVPPGGDWLLMRSDGAGELDVRLQLRTEEGEFIYVTYKGLLHLTPEIIERVGRGEAIPPDELYFRTTPYFETGSEKHAWLNKIVAVGIGEMPGGGTVCYQIYMVK